MNRIVVTGGCGFIGLNVIEFLLRKFPQKITVLDNLSSSKKEPLAAFDVEFVEGDIRDKELVKTLMKGTEAVIHLAADSGVIDSIERPDDNFDVNVKGTYNVLRAAHTGGVERFVFASTGGALIGEAASGVNEAMAPRPLSPYGASKLAAEGYCSAFAGSYGMKTVSLRFSNAYGLYSYHKGSVVATFLKRLLKEEALTVYGDGEQTRDFVFAEDLCVAIERAMHVERGGEVYQLGTGIQTSVNALIGSMKRLVGLRHSVRIDYEVARPGEVRHNFSDISKARRSLGYNPVVSLSEGLKRSWDWFSREKH